MNNPVVLYISGTWTGLGFGKIVKQRGLWRNALFFMVPSNNRSGLCETVVAIYKAKGHGANSNIDALYYRTKIHCVTQTQVKLDKRQRVPHQSMHQFTIWFWTNKQYGCRMSIKPQTTQRAENWVVNFFCLLTFDCFSVRLGGFVIFGCCHVERLRTYVFDHL